MILVQEEWKNVRDTAASLRPTNAAVLRKVSNVGCKQATNWSTFGTLCYLLTSQNGVNKIDPQFMQNTNKQRVYYGLKNTFPVEKWMPKYWWYLKAIICENHPAVAPGVYTSINQGRSGFWVCRIMGLINWVYGMSMLKCGYSVYHLFA